jgi:ABC-2 type transport system permease protein
VNARWSLLPESTPRAAFGKLVGCEARLAWRQPVGLAAGLGLPVLLLVIFGSIPSFGKPSADLGGQTPFNIYVPILLAFVIAALACLTLPGALASYRELGILRRLSTTPLPPPWLLAAQVIINFAITAAAEIIVVVVGIVAFGASVPKNPGWLVLAMLVSTAGLFAIGLWIAAVAGSARIANLIGAAVFYPMIFFAGMWWPQAAMPSVLRQVSDYTPLGAAVEAMQDAIQHGTTSWAALGALAGYAVVFGALALRSFRWE